MKKFSILLPSVALLFMSLFFVSCNDMDDYKYFLVPVEDISIPEEIKANEPFEVRFEGLIGINGCSSFDRFIADRQDTSIVVEAWGKLKTQSYSCPDMEVRLAKEKIRISIPVPGTYIIKVRQPDGSFFDKEFIVR